MCLVREYHDDCEQLVYPSLPFPFDFIDLTSDVDIAVVDDDDDDDDSNDEDVDEVVENAPLNDQWNYPYNMLPSVPVLDEGPTFTRTRGGILHFTRVDTFAEPEPTTIESSNETNQNTNNTSLNINFNITDTNDANQSNEGREFELNIPQILLSMSRIRIGQLASTSSRD